MLAIFFCRNNSTFFPSCFLSRGSAALHRLPILYPIAGALFVDIQIKIIRNEPRCGLSRTILNIIIKSKVAYFSLV